MLIAARNSFMAGSKPSAKSYVQNGLVAMWDGIENTRNGPSLASAYWDDWCGAENSFNVGVSGLSWDIRGLKVGVQYAGNVHILVSTALYNKFIGSGTPGKSATVEWCWTCTDFQRKNSTGGNSKVLFGISLAGTELGWCTICYRELDMADGGAYTGGPCCAWNGHWYGSSPLQSYIVDGPDAYKNVHTFSAIMNGDPTVRHRALNGIDTGDIPFPGANTARSSSRNAYLLPNISTGWSSKMICTIHCIRLYERKLSPSELEDNYAVDKARFNLPYDRRGVGGMNPDGSVHDDGLYFNRGTGAFVIGPDVSASNIGGGYKRQYIRRSCRYSLQPSARFWRTLWKEAA